MTSPKRNASPKVLPLNTKLSVAGVGGGARISTHEFWEDTVPFIAAEHRSLAASRRKESVTKANQL